MMIARIADAEVKASARRFPALVLGGARQAGKTTLLRSAFPKHRYVSLDLPSEAERAERDPGAFLAAYPPPLLVDEVQYAPGLFRHLKAAIDADRHAMGRFILTGSQHFVLMKNIADSLAGRAAVFELENFSFAELVRAGRLQAAARADFIRLIHRGQFPELWRDPGIPSEVFYSSYLATYLERDVRQILNVASLRDFERFIRVLAVRSGSLLNKSDVAKDVGVSVKAIGDWISVLETSGQIALLEPWFANFGKRIVKSPKVYFRDSGLVCFLLGLDARSLPRSPFIGAIWETFVFSELRKAAAYRNRKARLWFYRDQRAREVDFVVERGGRLCFVEAKWSEHPGQPEAKTIQILHDELASASAGWSPGRHHVVCPVANAYPIDARVRATPVDEIKSVGA